MNRYAELRRKQNERYAEETEKKVFYAFNDEQFLAGMRKIGVKSEDELGSLFGSGGYCRKSDVAVIRDLLKGFKEELDQIIQKEGTAFAKEVFEYELENHEFEYTMDLEETLDSLGMTLDSVSQDPILKEGLRLALERYGYLC